jgi:hypothetical protein
MTRSPAPSPNTVGIEIPVAGRDCDVEVPATLVITFDPSDGMQLFTAYTVK